MSRKFRPELNISFICGINTIPWEIGSSVLELLLESDPRLMPQKIGNSEPLKISVSEVSDCAPYWAPPMDPSNFVAGNAWDVMWKRSKKIQSSGHVLHQFRNRAGEVRPTWFIFRADPERSVPWKRLFEQLCSLLQPTYGTLHILGDIEQNSRRFKPEEVSSFGFDDQMTGLPPTNLERKGLANLACSNFFGSQFESLVSFPEIEKEGFPVKPLNDGYLVDISTDLFSVLDDFPEFSKRRAALKQIFPEGTFRIGGEPNFEK